MPARASISCSASFASCISALSSSHFLHDDMVPTQPFTEPTAPSTASTLLVPHAARARPPVSAPSPKQPATVMAALTTLKMALKTLQAFSAAFKAVDKSDHVGLQHCILGVHLLADSHDLPAIRVHVSLIALEDSLPVGLVGRIILDSVLPGVDAVVNGRLFCYERGEVCLIIPQEVHHRAVRGDEALVLCELERGDEVPPGATVAWRVVRVCEELARRVDEFDGHGCEVVEFGAPVAGGRVEVAEALQLRNRAVSLEARKRALGAVERRRHEAGGDADAVEGAAVRPRDNGYPAFVLGEIERGGETCPACVGWRGAFRVCDDLTRRVDEVDRLVSEQVGSAGIVDGRAKVAYLLELRKRALVARECALGECVERSWHAVSKILTVSGLNVSAPTELRTDERKSQRRCNCRALGALERRRHEDLARSVDELDRLEKERVGSNWIVDGRAEVAEALQLRNSALSLVARERALGEAERRVHVAGGEAEAVQEAVCRPDVHDAVGVHRRRGVDMIARLVLPLGRAVGVDRVEESVLRADVHGAVGAHRRRGVDKTACLILPLVRAVGVDRVEVGVVRPDVHGAVAAHRRRGVDFTKAVRPAKAVCPLARAVGVDRVEASVRRADVHGAVGAHRRRGGDRPLRRVLPLEAAVGVDRVEVVVVRADVHGAVGAHRRRGEDLSPRLVRPLARAVGSDCVEVVVPRADVHGAVGTHRRRGMDPIARLVPPLARAVGVDRVEVAVVRADVHGAVGANRRRGDDITPRLVRPLARAVEGVDRVEKNDAEPTYTVPSAPIAVEEPETESRDEEVTSLILYLRTTTLLSGAAMIPLAVWRRFCPCIGQGELRWSCAWAALSAETRRRRRITPVGGRRLCDGCEARVA
eukprot:scaffold95188_cov60-Phaeocystis_antarctica.AAC.2